MPETNNSIKFVVEVFTSKKGNKACAVVAVLPYGSKKFLTFDVNVCAELLKEPVCNMYDKPEGVYAIY